MTDDPISCEICGYPIKAELDQWVHGEGYLEQWGGHDAEPSIFYVLENVRAELDLLRSQRDQVLARTHVADAEDITDWQRGYRSCSDAVRAVYGPEPEGPANAPQPSVDATDGRGTGSAKAKPAETATAGLADWFATEIVDAAKALWRIEGSDPTPDERRKAHRALMATVGDLYQFETTGEHK